MIVTVRFDFYCFSALNEIDCLATDVMEYQEIISISNLLRRLTSHRNCDTTR